MSTRGRSLRGLLVGPALALLLVSGLRAQHGPPAPGLELGAALVTRGQVLCMRHEGEPLAAAARVWVVQPDTPQRVARAVPGTGSCATDVPEAMVPLRVVDGVLDSMRVGIAIVGLAAEPVLRGGVASVDLDGDGVPEHFRACTSSEGVHLTVWSGRPPRGRLRWHSYVYLGYDVEPDCSAADGRDPAPGDALPRGPRSKG